MYNKISLDESVYENFIESLYSCYYTAGQILDPEALAQQYGVSRTPVVHALRRLENEKILEVHKNGRFVVPVPDKKTVTDVCKARLIIEEEAINLIMQKPFDHSIFTELYRLAGISRESFETNDETESVKNDMLFHRTLVRCSGSQCLVDLHRIELNRFIGIKYTLRDQYETQKAAVNRHFDIIDHMRDGKSEAALKCIKEHILGTMQRLCNKVG